MDLHNRIVNGVLPRFAEKLKIEGLVSNYNRSSFNINADHFAEKFFFSIRPDLVLILRDDAKFLIEIVNSRDPKRLLGEIVYAQILGSHKLIDGGILFLLPTGPEHSTAPKKGMRLSFTSIATGMDQIISTKIPCTIASWSATEENNYVNLKSAIMYHSKIHLKS